MLRAGGQAVKNFSLDWPRVLLLGLIVVGLAYFVVDRTRYAPLAKHRMALSAQLADGYYSLFVAQADSHRRLAIARRGSTEVAPVADPILAVNGLVHDAAASAKVHVASVSPAGDPVEIGPLTRTPLKVEARGSYPAITRFIARMEAAPLLVRVMAVNVATSEASSAQPTATLTVVVVAPSGKERG